jgi:D-sedoheptulose 7-phosphate isomerase
MTQDGLGGERQPVTASTQAIHDMVAATPELATCIAPLQSAFEVLCQAFRAGRKLLVCGNGGSAADSEHIVGELMKSFTARRDIPAEHCSRLVALFPAEGPYLGSHLQCALPAISLVSQTSLLTALANDVGVDMIFAQQVYGYGQAGDVLLAISTSGASPNVLHALRVARALGLHTLGLAGSSCGAMAALCDVVVCAPRANVAAIQQAHQALYHALCTMLEAEFFAGCGETEGGGGGA